MNKIQLPDELIDISTAIVNHIHTGSALPNNIDQLEKWYELDGWDLLIGNDGLVGYALYLQNIASYKFNDSELRYEYELDKSMQITDSMRVKYGHQLIERAMEEYEGDVCPSVHCIKLSNGDNFAVIGCLIEIHGQGGPVPFWQGVFKTQDDLLKTIRANHIVMFDEIKNIKDEVLLSLWDRK
jgi:hypothetical protein